MRKISKMGVCLLSFLAALISMSPASEAMAEKLPRPLLLELFTSQGCSSCPPANAVLRELAMQPDLLALEFPVDYWNTLGWVDPFSSADFSARQQNYAARRGFGVYTPQLVIEGSRDAVGSNRSKIDGLIDAARKNVRAAPASISRKGDAVSLSIGALANAENAALAEVYLISFDPYHSTAVRGGENAGRILIDTNVVISFRRVGEWHNQAFAMEERLQPQEHGERLALIAQAADGTVWAIAQTSTR